MPVIEWKEPPPASTPGRGGSAVHAEIATELEANPGEWGFIGEASPGIASAINRGGLIAYRPRGAFQAVARNSRKNEQGKQVADLYARYVGDGQGDA